MPAKDHFALITAAWLALVALTLASLGLSEWFRDVAWLPLIVAGMALATFGFFASHSIASSWVSRRARAPQALASAFYLLFYYLGSSLIGSASGMMWGFDGWTGVVIMLGLCLGGGLLIALAFALGGIALPGHAPDRKWVALAGGVRDRRRRGKRHRTRCLDRRGARSPHAVCPQATQRARPGPTGRRRRASRRIGVAR